MIARKGGSDQSALLHKKYIRYSLKKIAINMKLRAKDTESFIQKSKDKYGEDALDYSEVNYIDKLTPVKLICKKCGNIFYQSPAEHLRDRKKISCPKCAVIDSRERRSIKQKEVWLRKCKDKFGDKFDYSKVNYINNKLDVWIYCNSCKKWFKQSPHHHIRNIHGCPFCAMKEKSGYEFMVESYLEYLVKNDKMLSYNSEYSILNRIAGRNSNKIMIDFKLNINNLEYWIEVNGQQHYKFINFFHKTKEDFQKQLKRDENVKEYCKENNIILIEIPYTYNTYEKISEVLRRILIGGESPNIIAQPKIIQP